MNTEDKLIYIQIPCSEELPKETGGYNTNLGIVLFSKEDEFFFNADVTHWLKPVSESKMACDFAEWIVRECFCATKYDGVITYSRQFSGKNREFYTTSELQKEFLKTYKG